MSDQDFFFDEDEKPASKQAKPAQSAKPAKPAPNKPAQKQPDKRPSTASASGFELTWTVTALIGVVALLLGVIIGYAIPKGAQDLTAGTTTGQTSAPQLSPDQISSGQLPPGHPDIGGTSGSSGTTGSATTTTSK